MRERNVIGSAAALAAVLSVAAVWWATGNLSYAKEGIAMICPMKVAGAQVRVDNIGKGVVIHVTGSDDQGRPVPEMRDEPGKALISAAPADVYRRSWFF